MSEFINAVCETVWGPPMLILVIGCGIYFTVSLKFLQIRNIREWTKETFGSLFSKSKASENEITPKRAVAAALASSIGTGNIVGVATAIISGGAGAVFWMWISAFFGMAVKYAEIFLAVKFRNTERKGFFGGPMYYIEKGLGGGYRALAVVFSISGALACLGMGAMSQSNSISSVLDSGIGISPVISGAVVSVITAMTISGGISKISKISEVLVPLMAGLYIFGGIAVIFIAPESSWQAFLAIFRSALTPRAVYGGAAGEFFRKGIRYGVARGIFSNEAGLGSAPIIHSAANSKSPVKQGFWGIFEVFVDTIVVCSITAIVILASSQTVENAVGTELVTLAFSEFFGSFGGVFVGGATILFSLATIFGWSYYGESCIAYLTRRKNSANKVYRILFVLSVFLGAIISAPSVWEIADMFNGIMMVPNIIALILLSQVVVRGTKKELR